ncbi:hemicentin-1-like [Saccostrea cucullata]|uniref:hemicentin-1-like n=1 Tax=Saccostrea cuccullata TaxID=36930 RepID=UPI002ED4BBB7
MKKLLTVFLFILFSVSTVKTCDGVEEIILQPYLGRKVTYPDDYPVKTGYEAGKNCSWKISAPNGYFVAVHPKWVCDADVTLGLYYGATTSAQKDGCVFCPKTNGYCSDIIQTRSSEALLSMLTVSPHSGGGFQFRFMAVERKTTSACVSSGTRLLAEKTPKFIMSPKFPSNYDSDLNCLWTVEPAVVERDTHLVFEFRSQYLEMGFDSCTDFVKINGLNEFCEQGEDTILQSSSPIQLTGVTANVRFTSDFGYSGSGFVLAFYIEKKETPWSCQHGGTFINSTCVCSRGYKGRSCENESLEILYFRSSKSVFREENEVLFESEITDNSNFTVQWSRNGVIISGISSRYSISSSAKANGTFLHQLWISSVYEREEGNWSIMASNGVTMVNRSTIIRVLPKLVLQMIPQYNLSIETKENLTLECVVVNPESLINLTDGSLIWVKDGKPFLTGSGFTISTTQNSTILNKASPEIKDSGSYSCLHSTYPDPLDVSIYVNITGPESVEILFFRISDSLSREGKSVWLETEIYDISDLSIQWFHNGNLITNSSLRYEIKSYTTENGTLCNVLNIPNALQQDEGDWNITASNGKTTESMSVYLRVLPRLVLWMMPPNDLSIENKESISLSCIVTNPESLFNLSGGGLFWQKDSKKISPDSGFNITTTDTSTTLMKSSAEIDDSGTYSCSHSAYPEQISVSIYINITEPIQPTVLLEMIPQGDFSLKCKEDINLRCTVKNSEFLMNLIGGSFIWQKNGKKILSASGYNVTSGKMFTTLRKPSAVLDDSGTYTCSHTASPGPVQVSVYINVTNSRWMKDAISNYLKDKIKLDREIREKAEEGKLDIEKRKQKMEMEMFKIEKEESTELLKLLTLLTKVQKDN